MLCDLTPGAHISLFRWVAVEKMNSERSCHSQGLEITSNNLPLLLISSLENSDHHPPHSFSPHFLASVNIATTYLVTQLHLSHRMVYHETQSSRATQLVYPETPSSRGQTTGLPRSPVLQWPYNSQECSDSGRNSWSTKASLQCGENHMLLQRLSNASSLRFTQLSPK